MFGKGYNVVKEDGPRAFLEGSGCHGDRVTRIGRTEKKGIPPPLPLRDKQLS